MPSKKKKYNARFPAGRIKKIMQTDEEVGKVAQAVPVIISRTLELFVESLLTKTMQITNAKNAKILSPTHMKQCILAENRFDFLKDLVKTLPDATSNDTDDGTSTQSNVLPPGTTTARVYKSRTSISRRRSSEDQITSRKKRRRINSDDNKTSSSSSLVNNNLTSNEDDDEDIEDIENIDDDDDGEDSDEKHENRLTILTPNTSMDPNGELDEDYDT